MEWTEKDGLLFRHSPGGPEEKPLRFTLREYKSHTLWLQQMKNISNEREWKKRKAEREQSKD
jgi:hypothetical protein